MNANKKHQHRPGKAIHLKRLFFKASLVEATAPKQQIESN